MSLDILLWASSKAALSTWAQTHPAANPLMTEDGPRDGVSYCWWGGDGKLRTGGTPEAPTFATGVVALMRLHSAFFESDKIAEDRTGLEQWQYSKACQWIKDNGSPGSIAGGDITYYEVDGVRLMRPADVEAFLAANSLPGHIWVDGNSY